MGRLVSAQLRQLRFDLSKGSARPGEPPLLVPSRPTRCCLAMFRNKCGAIINAELLEDARIKGFMSSRPQTLAADDTKHLGAAKSSAAVEE